MIDRKVLNDVYSNWLTQGGIFGDLKSAADQRNIDLPWDGDISNTSLAYIYHGNRSGSKFISSMLDRFTDFSSMRVPYAGSIIDVNIERWKKLYDIYGFEYDPIQNYDMEEEMLYNTTTKEYHKVTEKEYDHVRDDIAGSENRAISDGKKTHTYNNVKDEIAGAENRAISSGKVQHTYDNVKDTIAGSENRSISAGTATESNVAQQNEVRTNAVAGFNSSGFENSTQETISHPGGDNLKTYTQTSDGHDNLSYSNRENTRSGNEVDEQKTDGKDNLTYSGRYNQRTGEEIDEQNTDGKDNLSYSGRYNERTGSEIITESNADNKPDKEDTRYKMTRKGNIGVTTSQQMIDSEIKLWQWNYFENVIFPDLDRYLTLKVY